MSSSDNQYYLSPRAEASLHPPTGIRQVLQAFANAHDPETNPSGILILGIAENALVSSLLTSHLNKTFSLTSPQLSYGAGPSGSPHLHSLLANFLNTTLSPLPNQQLTKSNLHVSVGASAILDQLAFSLCAPNTEGILLSRPYYSGFITDFTTRSAAVPILVDFPADLDPVAGDTAAIVAQYTAALKAAAAEGVTATTLLICNPHNPLGICYSKPTLLALLEFARDHNLHYISDEIYAKSVYGTPETPFVSVYALDLEELGVPKERVHVVYGMSKDFGANGLRLGCLASFNAGLLQACGTVGVFSWPSSAAEECWANILADEEFLTSYFASVRSQLEEGWGKVKAWLEKKGIPYTGAERKGGYGFFLWADFSRWLRPVEGAERGGERVLTQRMLDGGVYLATGEAFGGPDGWYRVTFSVGKEVLELGLGRLEKVLKAVEDGEGGEEGAKVEQDDGVVLERKMEGLGVE